MNRLLTILIVLGAILLLPRLGAAGVEPMSDRSLTIPFSAKVLDGDDLPYDGTADVEAWFYRSPSQDVSELLYAESFSGASVERGMVRVSLLTGTALSGTSFSIQDFATSDAIYVDIKVDGQNMIELHPLRPWFAAMRAEHAELAEGIRTDFKLSEDEVPAHPASIITSGTFDAARIPVFPASRINSGTFEMGQVPSFSADLVQGGVFSPDAMPSSMDTSIFSKDELLESVISSDVMRDGDVGFDFGVVAHNGSVPVPGGFDRSQCGTVVSLRDIEGSGGVDQFHITMGTSGEVQCRWSPAEDGGDEQYCTVNYLIVCYR